MEYIVLFLGGFALSVIHALIPNHWVPIVSISKTQNWSKSFTNIAIVITSVSHSLSTIIVGSILGILGIEIFKKYEILSKLVPSGIFFIMGSIFISLHLFDLAKHHHHHDKETHFTHSHKKSIAFLIFSISVLFLTIIYLSIVNFDIKVVILSIIFLLVLTSLVLVQLTMSRKHKFYFYTHHDHDKEDNSLHVHDNTHTHHDFDHSLEQGYVVSKASKWGILLSLSVALFFSPCVEIEIYYIQAATLGIPGITLLSATYLITTLVFTFVLVRLGEEIVHKLKLKKLEHNEDFLTGLILVISGILFFFV